MVKVVISYDFLEGQEQACQQYLVEQFAPGLAQLGVRISDVWYTLWGDAPQITGNGEIEEPNNLRTIFTSHEWKTLADGMDDLTQNFEVRLVKLSEN